MGGGFLGFSGGFLGFSVDFLGFSRLSKRFSRCALRVGELLQEGLLKALLELAEERRSLDQKGLGKDMTILLARILGKD